MRNILKLVVLAAVVMAGIFMVTTRGTEATSAPIGEAKSDDMASPRSLYVRNCASCHGSNGKAQTRLGRKLQADDLTTSTASLSKVTRVITNGRGKMPSFKRRLKTAEIAQIAGYVKSL